MAAGTAAGSGSALSLTARILAVADVVDALAADRPYRPGMPPEGVRAILDSESGTHFDSCCVDACSADAIHLTQSTVETRLSERVVA